MAFLGVSMGVEAPFRVWLVVGGQNLKRRCAGELGAIPCAGLCGVFSKVAHAFK
jgi:hypothetical protein